MTATFEYEELTTADLRVDAIYRGKAKKGPRQMHHRDPFSPLLGVRAEAGFRWRGKIESSPFMVIYSDFIQAEWPDRIDETTGHVVYFGDNRKPGNDLHDVPGNRWLRDTFASAQEENRSQVMPTLVFSKGPRGRDTHFRGLAVPLDLVAIWRSHRGQRFQNYRATFAILDELTIPREWIDSLGRGKSSTHGRVPEAWKGWVKTGEVRPLSAAPVTRLRSKDQQLPDNPTHAKTLEAIHSHFPKAVAHKFEHFAKWLVEQMDENVISIDLTRPWRDGGRDGVGLYRIGPAPSSISVEFAIEAKCYKPGKTSVGVKDMSRLISRLRHRQFGVLVTTSYVHNQAYKEVSDDGHPVVILSGVDVIGLLPPHLRLESAIRPWLEARFPVD